MKIKAFHPTTSEEVWAWNTPELASKLEEVEKLFICDHPCKGLFKVKIRTGKPHVKLSCPDCGESLGSPVRQEDQHSILQELDVEAIRRNRAVDKFEEKRKIIISQKTKNTEYDQQWWKNYSIYLASDEWKNKRELKLERSDFICEGCGTEQATEVHHKSYKFVPFEMLFELQALCRACHDMLHLNRERRALYSKDKSTEHIICHGCRLFDERFNRPWCSAHNAPSLAALASENLCGPNHKSLDPLK